MAETIFMLNLKVGLNEEQYLRLKNQAELNRSEIEQEAEKILKSII